MKIEIEMRNFFNGHFRENSYGFYPTIGPNAIIGNNIWGINWQLPEPRHNVIVNESSKPDWELEN